ncbi:MAG TPA: hypothetical protein VN372_11820 [Methanospirillum sp.]|nr:hypothetical protein [Methanospirillum sp.]
MRVYVSLALLIFCLVLLSGCTGNQGSAPGSAQVQQPTAFSSPESSSASTKLQDLPSYPAPSVETEVSAQINEKDQTDKTITVLFSGGKGQKMVRDTWIMIKKSDGTISRIALRPEVLSEAVIQGTAGEDLVRVYAEYYDGKTYQIAERSVKMRQRI